MKLMSRRRRHETSQLPSFDDLMNPVLKALGQLGGRASVREIDLVVLDSLNLPEAVTATLHASHRNTRQTELQYRLTWARTFLRKVGLLEPSSRGTWSLTPKAQWGDLTPEGFKKVVSRHVVRVVTSMDRKKRRRRDDTA